MLGIHLYALAAATIAYMLPVGRTAEENLDRPIYCYQCNSAVDVDCPTLQKNNTNSIHYKPCNSTKAYNGQKPFCRKIVQTIFERNNMVRVIRKCGWERHPKHECYYASNDDHLEAVCQCFTNACNTAAIATVAAPLVMSAALTYSLVSWETSVNV